MTQQGGVVFAQGAVVQPQVIDTTTQIASPAVDQAENVFALGDVNYSNPFALDVTASSGGQSGKVKTVEPEVRKPASRLEKLKPVSSKGGWFFFILLIGLAFLALIVSVYRDEVEKRLKAFLNLNAANQLYKASVGIFSPAGSLLYVLFFFTMGTFIFKLAGFQKAIITGTPWFDLPICILGVALIYLLKHLQLAIVSSIFPFHNENSFYNFIIVNTNQIIGILLVPMLFFISFSPEGLQEKALWATFLLLGGAVLYRWIKGLAISSNYITNSKFHFLMYLCAVEIAPILVLIKLVATR